MKQLTAALFAAFFSLVLAGCGGSSKNNNGNVSVAEHTAPVGMWGGALVSDANMPAALTLTTSGGHFAFYCNQIADMTQEVRPDSSGHFSVAGNATFGFLPQRTPDPAQFSGTVTNHVMTVTLTVIPAKGTPYPLGPYTVTLGQTAPTFQGDCPG